MYDVNRVEVVRIQLVSRQHALRQLTLQRRKSKTIMRVTFQEKLDQPITESADAVVKNDWIGVGCRQSLELKRIDVIFEGLVPTGDSFFRAGQLHKVGTLRRFDDCAAQPVD